MEQWNSHTACQLAGRQLQAAKFGCGARREHKNFSSRAKEVQLGSTVTQGSGSRLNWVRPRRRKLFLSRHLTAQGPLGEYHAQGCGEGGNGGAGAATAGEANKIERPCVGVVSAITPSIWASAGLTCRMESARAVDVAARKLGADGDQGLRRPRISCTPYAEGKGFVAAEGPASEPPTPTSPTYTVID